MDKKEIKEALAELFDDRARIDSETHKTHHDFVATLIVNQERSFERWEKIKTQVIGAGVLMAVGAILTAVGHYVIELINKGNT